jgi:hypothetical protein
MNSESGGPQAECHGDAEVKKNTMPDIADLRLSQDFGSQVGVKKVLTQVPVRKPDRQWFFRVRPGEEWRLDTAVLELRDDRETYLVSPELRGGLSSEVTLKKLVTAINRQGVVFVWPIALPGFDGRSNSWNDSALDAVAHAEDGWISLRSNMQLGAYEIFEAFGLVEAPEWPEGSFQDLINLAFKNRYINTPDHPVLRRLRGDE